MKGVFISGLVRLIVRFPGIMESGVFMAILRFFPARIAKKYDRLIAGQPHYSSPLREGVLALRELCEADGTYPGNVIDLCTGTGVALLEVRKVFPEASIYAVDQSETMVALAREKAKEADASNTVFLTADASQLSFNDDYFDVAVISNAPVFFTELKRVLRPRGRVLITLSFAGRLITEKRDDITSVIEKLGFVPERIVGAGNGVYVILRSLVPASGDRERAGR